jgi:hypothetical protein
MDAYILVSFGMADRYTRLGQNGRNSTHICWPAGYSPSLSRYMRTRGGDITFIEHQQGQRGASYCRLCHAKTVRRCCT